MNKPLGVDESIKLIKESIPDLKEFGLNCSFLPSNHRLVFICSLDLTHRLYFSRAEFGGLSKTQVENLVKGRLINNLCEIKSNIDGMIEEIENESS